MSSFLCAFESFQSTQFFTDCNAEGDSEMSGAAFKLQQRRRDQERVLQETHSFLRQQHDTERLLDWENRTYAQIQQREVSNLTQQLLRQDENELKKRQDELQALYGGEMDQWKENLKNKLEVTPEQRMEQIRERAYALKEKREAERQEFVKECYERQWRDSCDDLRVIDSKAIMDRLAEDRKLMVNAKKKMEQQQREIIEDCDCDTMALLQDREEDEINRREINIRTKLALDQQIRMKREERETISALMKQEEEEQIQRKKKDDEQLQSNHTKLLQKAKEDGDDMYQQMLERKKLREENKKLESEQDLILLKHALEKERRAIETEKAKKLEGKEAGAFYVQCLRAQLKDEAEERCRTNAIRDESSEKIFQKNDERLAAEAERKRQWMEQVQLSRQEQIKMKQREIERLRLEEEIEVRNNELARIREEEVEKQKEEQVKADRIAHSLANTAIMNKMNKDREMEQQEKFLLQKQILYAERIHQDKMKACSLNNYFS